MIKHGYEIRLSDVYQDLINAVKKHSKWTARVSSLKQNNVLPSSQ